MANQPYYLSMNITVTLRDNPSLVQIGARRRVAPTDQQFLEALQGTHLNIGGPGFFVPNIGIYTSPEFDTRFGALLQYGIDVSKWEIKITGGPSLKTAYCIESAMAKLTQQIRDYTAKHPIKILTASAPQPATRIGTCDDGAVVTLGTACLSEVNLDRFVIPAKTRKQVEAFLANVRDCNDRLPAPEAGSPVGECLSGGNEAQAATPVTMVDLTVKDDVTTAVTQFMNQWAKAVAGPDAPIAAEAHKGAIVVRPTPGPCPTFQAIGRSLRTPRKVTIRTLVNPLNYKHIDPGVIEYTGEAMERGELVLPLLARHRDITAIHINGLPLHPFCWKVAGDDVILDVDVIGYTVEAGDWFGITSTPRA